jgi:beta-glucosidase-like glycosyl hydrolase
MPDGLHVFGGAAVGNPGVQLVERMPARRGASRCCHWWNECLHGVARAGVATMFPQAIAMAASFDDELLFQVAEAISDEVRAKHHEAKKYEDREIYKGLTMWSPNVNIFRDPR